MPFMEWNASLDLGIAEFDNQHKQLVALLNDLYDAMRGGHGKDVIGRILESLVQYTKTHFVDEEWFLKHNAYPDLAAHKAEHVLLTRQVLDAQKRYMAQGSGSLSVELLDFLKTWLSTHIQKSDLKYRDYLSSRKAPKVGAPVIPPGTTAFRR